MAQPYTCEKLIKACYFGKSDAVLKLANSNNVNGADRIGYTPLQITMIGYNNIEKHPRYLDTATTLIMLGANPLKSKHPLLAPAVDIALGLESILTALYTASQEKDIAKQNASFLKIEKSISVFFNNTYKKPLSVTDSVMLTKFWNTIER